MLPGKNIAVVGKVTWPNLPDDRISFLMSHLQGSGEQQFGFHSLVPYTWLDWRFFYPENVSFKRSVVADWVEPAAIGRTCRKRLCWKMRSWRFA